VLLGVLALTLFQLSENYAFFVYEADIRGNRLLLSEDLYRGSGIHQRSIFWLIPREIKARLESHPYVKQATVQCRLPGAVRINVVERVPRIAWIRDEGALWIDGEGISLTPLTTESPGLTLADDKGLAGQADGMLQPGIVEGILLIADLMPEISQFRFDDTWGLLFQKPDGAFVALGEADRMQFKIQLLLHIEEETRVRGEQPQLVDLRFPDAPYYR
jgi:hypothetical protein